VGLGCQILHVRAAQIAGDKVEIGQPDQVRAMEQGLYPRRAQRPVAIEVEHGQCLQHPGAGQRPGAGVADVGDSELQSFQGKRPAARVRQRQRQRLAHARRPAAVVQPQHRQPWHQRGAGQDLDSGNVHLAEGERQVAQPGCVGGVAQAAKDLRLEVVQVQFHDPQPVQPPRRGQGDRVFDAPKNDFLDRVGVE
jgi:hypothetical protein